MAIMESSILTRDLQPPGFSCSILLVVVNLGEEPSIVNPTDAITKDNTVPLSARTRVNKTDSAENSMGAGVGIN